MGMRLTAQIGYVGSIGKERENDKVIQLQEIDQGQVGGPQVRLPGHEDEVENPNWASRACL